jgi:hypothetical protein
MTPSLTRSVSVLAIAVFEYGDFRDEEASAHKFEGFLVVASSKGDTLSLFESKT